MFVLSPLDEADRAALAAVATATEHPAGATLIREGERLATLRAITAGTVAITASRHGAAVEVARLGPGDILGELSFATGEAAAATATALTPCRTADLSAAGLAQADAARPGLEARLLRGLARLVHARLRPAGPAALVLPDLDATLRSLRAVELPAAVGAFITRYEQVGDRGGFLWRWCWHGLQSTCLLPADAPWRAHTLAARLVAVILNVMLDDLADRPGTEVRFEQAVRRLDHPTPPSLRAPWAQLGADERYDALIGDLWHHVLGACTVLPRWERFRRLWHFDYQQVFNCMRYSMLTRELPSFDSLTENRAYVPHNMNMMVFCTMDFMAGELPEASLGAVREAVWLGQSIGQLGNMIATWRREVPHRDFSSRIFTVARSRGVLTADELASLPPDAIEARVEAAGLEADLLAELASLRAGLAGLAAEVRAADLSGFAAGVDTLIAMNLAARGLI